MEIREILNERQKTHGDFTLNAQVSQDLKTILTRAIQREGNNVCYKPYELEALDMICHKLSRIVAGNHAEPDHWRDLSGYSTLVADRLELDKTITTHE